MDIQARVAVLESELIAIKTSQTAMALDVRAIRDAVLEARGGWKTLMILGGASAAFGAFAVKWIPTLLGGLR